MGFSYVPVPISIAIMFFGLSIYPVEFPTPFISEILLPSIAVLHSVSPSYLYHVSSCCYTGINPSEPNVRTFVIKLFIYMASPHSFWPYLLRKSSLAACCISIICCCFSSCATGEFICCSSPLLSNMTKWV